MPKNLGTAQEVSFSADPAPGGAVPALESVSLTVAVGTVLLGFAVGHVIDD